MKTIRIIAEFPEVIVRHHLQEARATAGSLPLAIARGLREIMKRDGIKGRRIRRIKVSAVVVEPGEQKEDA